ncbi:MAG: hypothetical protein GW778_06780 [Alphaproteobacteria bacterium]|nr:hypothetical protein [Alphaproteobacteria bacterium]
MYSAKRDVSLLALLFGNVLSAVMAVKYGWSLGEVMWIYWGQSVVIGVTNFIRMMSLREFSTEGLTSNGSPVPATEAGKRSTAIFFAIHYGMFHAGYAVFLWAEMPLAAINDTTAALMIVCLSAFVLSHSFSLTHNMGRDFKQKKPNLGTLMFYPYMRIIPMHLTIIFGSLSGFGMLIFMVLKTFADLGMHMVEHHIFQKPDAGAARMQD